LTAAHAARTMERVEKMVINLSKDCRVVGEDGIQFTLQVLRSKGPTLPNGKPCKRVGERYWDGVGYYGTLSQAVSGALKHSLLERKGEVSTKELLAYLLAFESRVRGMCDAVCTASGSAAFEGEVDAAELDSLFAPEAEVSP